MQCRLRFLSKVQDRVIHCSMNPIRADVDKMVVMFDLMYLYICSGSGSVGPEMLALTRPPIRSLPSTMVTSIPYLINTSAHRRPVIPAPTMQTWGVRPFGRILRSMIDAMMVVIVSDTCGVRWGRKEDRKDRAQGPRGTCYLCG